MHTQNSSWWAYYTPWMTFDDTKIGRSRYQYLTAISVDEPDEPLSF